MIRTSTIGKDTHEAQKMVNRYFKTNRLKVREHFSSVKSEHIIQQTPSSRVRLSLDDENFVCVNEVKSGDAWVPSDGYAVSGDRKSVENSFFNAIAGMFTKANA
ncbi:hypothetical protein IJ541_05360 [bacterium]|nr:hypothetical protein [bacterium]